MKRVLVHHPGKELKLANSNPLEHHFDQPVDIDRFISDHRSMMDALEEAGIEVYSKALSGLVDFERLFSYEEIEDRIAEII